MPKRHRPRSKSRRRHHTRDDGSYSRTPRRSRYGSRSRSPYGLRPHSKSPNSPCGTSRRRSCDKITKVPREKSHGNRAERSSRKCSSITRERSRSTTRQKERQRTRSRSQSKVPSQPHIRQSSASRHRASSRSIDSHPGLDRTLDTIITRLETIENNLTSSTPENNSEITKSTTQALVDAIQTLVPTRTQNYYVSNFDPDINDIDAWCDEVNRARLANRWEDRECLSRVAGCLRGNAKTWLNEWVSNEIDRGVPLCANSNPCVHEN